MTRLRSDFWVAAFIRRCNGEGADAVLQRRGAAEAGAIFILMDRLDGALALYGPAPQSETGERGVERRFARLHKSETIDGAEAQARLARQAAFDPDLWIVAVEDRAGRVFFDLSA